MLDYGGVKKGKQKMKKILMSAAIVMVAAATRAAAVGWSIAGASTYAGGSYDIFIIGQNGVTSQSQIAALVQAGTSVESYTFYSGGSVSTTGLATLAAATSGKSLTYKEGGTTAENTYQAFAVIWDKDNKNASYTSLASTTLANNSTSKTFTFGNQSSNLSNNSFVVAPEPTSGLLLLLGMAGLALKRKRA